MNARNNRIKPDSSEEATDSRYSEIIDRLRSFPDVAPPQGIAYAVVQKLTPKKVQLWQRLRFALSHPVTISFVPLKWAPALACVVLLFLTVQSNLKQMPSWNPKIAEAENSYILGRMNLSENKPGQAISLLQKAADLVPDNPDYHFWVGVTHWALEDYQNELKSYRAALDLRPDYLPAHVYMGHSYLDQGQWNEALTHYRQVLSQVPDHPEALYNTGLALRKLGDTEKEKIAWKTYLDANPSGPKSPQAIKNLYSTGDFSYQLFTIESNRTALKTISFDGDSLDLTHDSMTALFFIGRQLENHPDFNLHVIVHVAGNQELAKKQAKTIKNHLISTFPSLEFHRIGISWFDAIKSYEVKGKQFELASDIRLFAEPADRNTRI